MKFLILFALTVLVSCKYQTVSEPVQQPAPVVEATPISESTQERVSLSWENTTEPHPERSPWSDKLVELFKQDLSLFGNAEDMTEICPKFKTLQDVQKLKALGEFMVATAYYESGYKPGQYSVDVGTKGDKGSWSVGLYQMSANDNSAKQIGASFEGLKDPLVNIEVAMIQMKKQIEKRNKFFLNNSDSMRYWAVLLRSHRYSQINEIKARTLKNAPACK